VAKIWDRHIRNLAIDSNSELLHDEEQITIKARKTLDKTEKRKVRKELKKLRMIELYRKTSGTTATIQNEDEDIESSGHKSEALEMPEERNV